MGNSYQKNNAIKKSIQNYTPGNVDEFINIMQTVPKPFHSDFRFKAWKLACIRYFITHLDDDQHDIAENDAKILIRYQELEAHALNGWNSDNPEVKKSGKELLDYMYMATGYDKYNMNQQTVAFSESMKHSD